MKACFLVLLAALHSVASASIINGSEASLVALTTATSFDTASLAVLLGSPTHSGLLNGSGTLDDSGWALLLSGTYMTQPLSIEYTGVTTGIGDSVQWTATGTLGTRSWDELGLIVFDAAGNGLWNQEVVIGDPDQADTYGATVMVGVESSNGKRRLTYTGQAVFDYIFGDTNQRTSLPVGSTLVSDPYDAPKPQRYDWSADLFFRTDGGTRSSATGSALINPLRGGYTVGLSAQIAIPEPATRFVTGLGLLLLLYVSVGSRTGAVFRRLGLSVCSPFPLGVPLCLKKNQKRLTYGALREDQKAGRNEISPPGWDQN